MSKRFPRGKLAYVTIAIILLATVFSNFDTAPVSAVTIPRDQTVWGAGFGQNTGTYQPWGMGANQAWTTYLMYEPMFGTNVATGNTINWLGKSIAWGSDDRTIVITLRSGLHWTSVDPGNTLGVTNSTPITTDDVIYSFQILQQMGQIGSLVQRVGDIKTAFVKVSDTQLDVTILPAYAGSSEVMRQLTYGFLIFPKAVWQDINTTKSGQLQNFDNNWLLPTTPAKWKVASGMYLPFYFDSATCVAVRSANWWGKSDPDFGRLPNPQYWGYTRYATNDLALLAMEQGDLDWDGHYLAGLDSVKASYSNIVTYFANAPYFPDKSVDLLVPNYKNYPLNQTWLHKALMSVIDYSAMSAVDSGYLKTPNVMLIPADDAAAQATLNQTLVTQYSIAYDGTGAYGKNLLSTYCNFDPATQTWFTKAEVGGHHVPLAEWDGVSNSSIAPWTILDFNGWTDVDAMDVIAAYSFTHVLNISVVVDQGPANQWGVVQNRVNSYNFDLFNMVMSGQLNMNMYERYFQMFSLNNPVGAGGGINAPLGGYKNTTLSNLMDQLETKPAGSVAQWAVANQIQTIIGTDLPYIPLGGYADWQVYSTTYWTNWPNNATNPMLPGSPYAGPTQNANLLAITFGLHVKGTGDTTTPATITDLATGSPTSTWINLTWTAPGDNGTFGNATGYVVKYSTLGQITAANWTSATTFTQSWTPAKNGTLETHTVSGLSPATKYWFAVEAYDAALNYGGVSNSPSGTTLVPPPPYAGLMDWLMICVGFSAVATAAVIVVVLVRKKSN